jgi:hypothetical protein
LLVLLASTDVSSLPPVVPPLVSGAAGALSALVLPLSLAESPCAATCSSTLLPGAPPASAGASPFSSASCPPATLAIAEVSLRATDVAPTLTPSTALMSRSTEAITVSLAMPTAIEAPTATWLPWVWPVATVVCSLLWSAWLL